MRSVASILRGRGLAFALMSGVVLSAHPVLAGFEWKPQEQSTAVPVIAPEVAPVVQEPAAVSRPSRQMLVPSQYSTQQPVEAPKSVMPRALPMLEEDKPTYDIVRQDQSVKTKRLIGKAPAYKVPASAMTMEKTVSQPEARPVSKNKIFTPMPGDEDLYKHSAQEDRITTEPVPLVLDNMKDITGSSSNVYVRRPNKVAVHSDKTIAAYEKQKYPAAKELLDAKETSIAAPVMNPVVMPKKSAVVKSSSGSIKINPYPTQTSSSQSDKVKMHRRAVQQQAPVISSYSDVAGFGSDLPMIMAIQQVVPPSYTYSFAPSVNLSQRVSWQGDRPWNVVLQDMLRPHGYSAQIGTKSLMIR